MTSADPEKFFRDLRATLDSAAELLHASAHTAGEHVTQARNDTLEGLRAAGQRLHEMEEGLLSASREKVQEADEIVRENPWWSMGAAAGLAFVLGVLVGRRR